VSGPWSGAQGRDFRVFWAGTAVSQVGTAVTGLALPLLVLLQLGGGAGAVGALRALEFAPYLLLGLPAGLLVDRRRRRSLMIGCDLARALALGAVPLASATGHLSLGLVLVVVFMVGCATVPFDVASLSALPWLVERERLGTAQAALQGSGAAAEVVGPGLSGVLVAAVQATNAVLLDAVTYAVSAVALLLVRRPEPAPEPPAAAASLRVEVLAGLRQLRHSPLLLPLVSWGAVANLLNTATQTVGLVFAVREVHLSSSALGLTLAAGILGAPLGAVTSNRVAARLGVGRLLVLTVLLEGAGFLAFGAAMPGPLAVVQMAAGLFLATLGSLWFNVQSVALRQAVTPPAILGRVHAAARTSFYATIPLGGALGGLLATAVGDRAVVLGGATATLLSVVLLTRPAVLRLTAIPHQHEPVW